MTEASEHAEDAGAPGEPGRARRDLIEEAVVLGFIALVIGAYAWDVRDIPQQALNLMVMRPVLVIAAILILIVLGRFIVWPLVAGHARRPATRPAAAGPRGSTSGGPTLSRQWVAMLAMAGLLVAYVAVFPWLPFVVSTALFMTLALVALGNRKPLFVAGVSVATALALYLVGRQILGVDLP